MSSSFIEPDKVKQAILHATINLAGVALVAVVWLNYILLKPYIRPLFWATIFSVPLHAIKNEILAYINDSVDNHNISLPHVFWLSAKFSARLCFGPLYTLVEFLLLAYYQLVQRLSKIDTLDQVTEKLETTPSSISPIAHHPLSMAWAESNVVTPISALFDQHYPWIKELGSPDLRRRNSDQFLKRNSRFSLLSDSPMTPTCDSPVTADTDPNTTVKSSLVNSPQLSHFPQYHSLDSFLTDPAAADVEISTLPLSPEMTGSPSNNAQSTNEQSTSLSLPILPTTSNLICPEIIETPSTPPLEKSPTRITRRCSTFGTRTPRLKHLNRDLSPARRRNAAIQINPDLHVDIDEVAAAIDSSQWYLFLVWRLSCVWFMVSVWHTLGPVRQSAIGVLIGAVIGTQIMYHLLRRLFVIYFGGWAKHAIQPMEFWINKVWTVLAPGCGWVRKTWTSSRHNAKQAFVRNANSFAALFVLISILSMATFLSVFLIFKVGQESATLVESVVGTIEKNLSEEMRAKFQNVIQDTSDVAMGWIDTKVQENFPHLNVTALYRYLSLTFQGSSSINTTPVATSTTSTTLSDTDATQMLAGELTRLTKLPHTAHIIARFLGGDFLVEGSIIFGMVDEMRNVLTKGVDVGAASGYLSSLLGSLASVSLAVMVGLLRVTLDFFDVVFQVTIFLITLHALLSRETAITTWFAQLLILADPDMILTRSLEDNLISVVWCTTKLTAFHSLLTWLTFSAFGVDLVYLSTVLTAVLTVVPFFPPVWIAVVASISLYWRYARGWSAVVLLSIHVWASYFLDSAFYAQIPDVNSYFSALAVILGLWAFGLEGLVLGPLLLSVVPSVFSVVSQQIQSRSGDSEMYSPINSAPCEGIPCGDDSTKKNI